MSADFMARLKELERKVDAQQQEIAQLKQATQDSSKCDDSVGQIPPRRKPGRPPKVTNA